MLILEFCVSTDEFELTSPVQPARAALANTEATIRLISAFGAYFTNAVRKRCCSLFFVTLFIIILAFVLRGDALLHAVSPFLVAYHMINGLRCL